MDLNISDDTNVVFSAKMHLFKNISLSKSPTRLRSDLEPRLAAWEVMALPFTFLFDETMTFQIKKHYGAYATCNSNHFG